MSEPEGRRVEICWPSSPLDGKRGIVRRTSWPVGAQWARALVELEEPTEATELDPMNMSFRIMSDLWVPFPKLCCRQK